MTSAAERKYCNDTPVARSWLGGDHIFVIEIKPGAEVTLEQAQRDMETNRRMEMDAPIGVLLDVRGIKSIDRKARELYTKHEEGGHEVRGTAIVIKSIISRMIANFFIGFNRPGIPVKLFTSVDTARTWLKEQLDT